MQPFNFVRPQDIDDALSQLAQPGSRILAGGTNLVDLMKLGVEVASTVVDIGGLPLSSIAVEDSALIVGALVSNREAAQHSGIRQHAPAVSQALLSGASGQIRNAATMGGNLLQRTRCTYFRSPDWPCNKRAPGTGCAALDGVNGAHAVLGTSRSCIAVHPSDLAVALLAADAHVHLESLAGKRRVAMGDFYCLPGDTPDIETVIRPDELIVSIEIPLTRLNATSSYLKLRGRSSYEFALASVASAVIFEGDVISEAAVSIGGLGVIPWRNRAAERMLIGHPLTDDLLADFCDVLFSVACTTPANAYRLALARGAVRRNLQRGAGC